MLNLFAPSDGRIFTSERVSCSSTECRLDRWRMNDSVGVASMRGNREYRLVLSWPCVDHSKEHHDE
jgi:hypothetical protein